MEVKTLFIDELTNFMIPIKRIKEIVTLNRDDVELIKKTLNSEKESVELYKFILSLNYNDNKTECLPTIKLEEIFKIFQTKIFTDDQLELLQHWLSILAITLQTTEIQKSIKNCRDIVISLQDLPIEIVDSCMSIVPILAEYIESKGYLNQWLDNNDLLMLLKFINKSQVSESNAIELLSIYLKQPNSINLIKSIYETFVDDHENKKTDNIVIMAHFIDPFLDHLSEFNFLEINNYCFWTILHKEAIHNNIINRKYAMLIFKKIVDKAKSLSEPNGFSIILPSGNYLLHWEPSLTSVLTQEWHIYFTLMDTLNTCDKQSHLIMPMLENLSRMTLLPKLWKAVTLYIVLKNDNIMIVRYGIIHFLKYYFDYNNCEFLLEMFLTTINNTSLYPIDENYEELLINFIKYYYKVIINIIGNTNWLPVPLYFILNALEKSHVNQTIKLSNEFIEIIRKISLRTKTITNTYIRSMCQVLLVKFISLINISDICESSKLWLQLFDIIQNISDNCIFVHLDKWFKNLNNINKQNLDKIYNDDINEQKEILLKLFYSFVQYNNLNNNDLNLFLNDKDFFTQLNYIRIKNTLDFYFLKKIHIHPNNSIEKYNKYLNSLLTIDNNNINNITLTYKELTMQKKLIKEFFLINQNKNDKILLNNYNLLIFLYYNKSVNDNNWLNICFSLYIIKYLTKNQYNCNENSIIINNSIDISYELINNNNKTVTDILLNTKILKNKYKIRKNIIKYIDIDNSFVSNELDISLKIFYSCDNTVYKDIFNYIMELFKQITEERNNKCFIRNEEFYRTAEQFVYVILNEFTNMKKSEAFWTSIDSYVKMLFSFGCDDDLWTKTIILPIVDKLLKLSINLSGLGLIIFRELLKQDFKYLYQYDEIYNIILIGLLYGNSMKRDMRIEADLCKKIIEKNPRISKTRYCHDANERVRAMTILTLMRFEYTLEKCIYEKIFTRMIDILIKELNNLNDKKPRYYPDSIVHRHKLRTMQALAILFNYNNELSMSIKSLLFNENNQINIKYLSCLILFNNNDILDYLFNIFNDKTFKINVNILPHLFTIIYQRCCFLNDTNIVEKSLKLLYPFTMSQNYLARLYAQITIYKLIKYFSLYNFNKLIYDTIVVNIEKDNEYPLAKQYLIDFRYKKFNSSKYLIIKNIFDSIPRITYMASDDRIPFNTFVECSKELNINFKEENDQLLDDTEHLWLKKTLELEDNIVNHNEYELNDVQRKIIPIRTLLPNYIMDSKRDNEIGLIVVASLVSRLPNLGGLARTCEVFGVKNYIVDSLSHLKSKEFQSLSVTSEKWLFVTEIKIDQLTNYIKNMKMKGFKIFGAEQTANSQQIEKVLFPKKSILILGHEKEGIPSKLLTLLDVVIEIPQYGQIRSLNVHVSGAIIMWEYAKQHLVNK